MIACEEYQQRVIALFQSGKATTEQWLEMARAVCDKSESDEAERVLEIDMAIIPEEIGYGRHGKVDG